jgi:hypothetical protein
MVWFLVIGVQFLHWFVPQSKNECILSYWEKKSEDPTYVKGSQPEKTFAWILLQTMLPGEIEIITLRRIHFVVTKCTFVLALFMITVYNQCVPNYNTLKWSLFGVLGYLAVEYVCFDSAICTQKTQKKSNNELGLFK